MRHHHALGLPCGVARHDNIGAAREGLAAKTIDQGALDRLGRHSWPGNVRELENLLRRVCALYAEPVIGARIIERELAEPISAVGDQPVTLSNLVERYLATYFAGEGDDLPAPGLYDRVLAEVERPLFELTLAATRGNQLRAADVLGLNRNTLRKRLADLGIDASRGRK